MRYSLATWLTMLLLCISQVLAGERTITLIVENMTCAACPYIVEKSLAAVPGVMRVEVSFKTKTAKVTFDDSQADVAALEAATAQAGYKSQPVPGSGG